LLEVVRLRSIAVFGGRDGGHGRADCCVVLIVATRTADRAAQELWLLVRFGGQTITGRTLTTARRHGSLGAFQPFWAFWARLDGTDIGSSNGRALEAFGTVPVHAMLVPVGTVGTVAAILTIGTLEALLTIGAVVTILPVAEAAAITLVGAITVAVAVARTLMLVALFAVQARLAILEAAFAAILEARLIGRAVPDGGLIGVAIEAVVGIHVAFGTVLPVVGAVVSWIGAALAYLLFAVGHDDAIIMLRVLEIILGQHRIAGRLGIARERHIFLGDVSGRAAQLHIRTIAFEAPRQRILAFALLIVLIVVVIVAAAASAVLLSLPHGLRSQPV
jgi:hypothetical protein